MANPNYLSTDDSDESDSSQPTRPRSVVPHVPVGHIVRSNPTPDKPVVLFSRLAFERATEEDDEDEEDTKDSTSKQPAVKPAQDHVEKTTIDDSDTAEVEPAYPYPEPVTILPRQPRDAMPVGPLQERTPLSNEERAQSEALLRAATTQEVADATSGDSLTVTHPVIESPFSYHQENATEAPGQASPSTESSPEPTPLPASNQAINPFAHRESSPSEMPQQNPESSMTEYYAAEDRVPVVAAGGGSGRPPMPPVGPPGNFNHAPEPEPTPVSPWQPTEYARQTEAHAEYSPDEYGGNLSPFVVAEQARQNEAVARRHGQREGLVAGGLVGWWLGRRRANRKTRNEMKRVQEKATEQEKLHAAATINNQEAMSRLRNHNDELQRSVFANQARSAERSAENVAEPLGQERAVNNAPLPPRVESMPLTSTMPNILHSRTGNGVAEAFAAGIAAGASLRSEKAPKSFRPEQAKVESSKEQAQESESDANEQGQQPDHYVRSEWLNIGVDKEGRTVGVQQEYGRAFHEEVRQEQVGTYRGQQDSGSPSGGGTYQGPMTTSDYYAGGVLASGQVADDHTLPSGQAADAQHRLSEPRKQIVSNIANPWFWLMLSIIVVAFFAAALI